MNTISIPITTSITTDTSVTTDLPVDINKLKTAIERLDSNHHIHIGSILRQHSLIKLNTNKNGILVNFSTIPEEVLQQIQTYVEYVADQEQLISKMESTAEELKQFIASENTIKDNFGISIN